MTEAILTFGIRLPDEVVLPWEQANSSPRDWWLEQKGVTDSDCLDSASAQNLLSKYPVPAVLYTYGDDAHAYHILAVPGFSITALDYMAVEIMPNMRTSAPDAEQILRLREFVRSYVDIANPIDQDPCRVDPISDLPLGWWLCVYNDT